MVAALLTYGCSPAHIRLQPASHTVAGAPSFRFSATRAAEQSKAGASLKVAHPKVTALAFDASGRRLLTGAQDGLVRVWNFSSGQVSQP